MAEKYDVIIIGGGPNGLTTACYLSKAGEKVLLLEKRYELGGGRVDYAVPCVGNADAIMKSFGSIHAGGKCVVVGLPPISINLNVAPFELLQGKILTGTTQGDVNTFIDVPRYVDLYMAGKLPIDKLITKRCGLSEINEAYRALEKGEVIRTVIKF